MVALVVVALPQSASAQRTHTVEPGDTLSRLADRYNVASSNLAAANRLGRDSVLTVGRELKIPKKGWVYVGRGQTLSGLAKLYGVSTSALAKRNGLSDDDTLRIGQRLALPGRTGRGSRVSRTKSSRQSKSARSKRGSRVVWLYRPALSQSMKLKIIDRSGRLLQSSRNKLSTLFRDRRTHRKRRPNPRLLRLVARVSKHFGGKRMVVISGFRPPGKHTRRSSRHTRGDAVDFRIDGVPNQELRDYCRRFERVGVGYYPRSSFVHLDVRPTRASWIDWSRPGEAPRYLKPGELPEDDAVDIVVDDDPKLGEANTVSTLSSNTLSTTASN